MRYTVSENVEIILDGHRYLLEAGDVIILEAYIDLERVYGEIAEAISNNFEISPEDIELIKEGLFGEIENYDQIKSFVKRFVKSRSDLKFKITDNVIGDILTKFRLLLAPADEAWKRANIQAPSNMRQFAGEKEKIDREKAAERKRLEQIFNPQ